MTTDLAQRPAAAVAVNGGITEDQKALIKRTIAPDATDDELAMFVHHANKAGLDPLARQMYFMKVRGKATFTTSIDGFRLVADRTGKYAGQLGPQWCGSDGEWKDVWLEDGPPAAARVGILRDDFDEPLWNVAVWREYVKLDRDGNVTAMWRRFGSVMLAKCAESGGLRKSFPQELSGLYTGEEMAQADNPAPRELLPSEQPPVTQAAAEAGAPSNGLPQTPEEWKATARTLQWSRTQRFFVAAAEALGEGSDDLAEVNSILDQRALIDGAPIEA